MKEVKMRGPNAQSNGQAKVQHHTRERKTGENSWMQFTNAKRRANKKNTQTWYSVLKKKRVTLKIQNN